MSGIIEVRDLTKVFTTEESEVEALHDINLSIQAGDIYGIIGMSGAGKSTLVRCLNFLERPTKGTVEIGGRDLSAMSERELRGLRSQSLSGAVIRRTETACGDRKSACRESQDPAVR